VCHCPAEPKVLIFKVIAASKKHFAPICRLFISLCTEIMRFRPFENADIEKLQYPRAIPAYFISKVAWNG
jgi:hypothetical protein